MAKRYPIVNLIVQGARRRGLDPNAVLAVARVEGLSGRVGDQGTSFGPFQLHVGGALPRGVRNPQQWASSPAGINYALDRIASVARGKRGRAAVAAIVSQFERPANIPGEIARAAALYGGSLPMGQPMPLPGVRRPAGVAQAGLQQPGLMAALSYGNELFGLPAALPSLPVSQPRSRPATVRATPAQPKMKRGRTIKYLEHFAAPYGLQVTSTTGGKHVKNSYHYRGRAVDLAGSPAQMMQLARQALQHPEQFTEMFYDPLGFYIKNGKVIRGSIGGHSDHVHIAR